MTATRKTKTRPVLVRAALDNREPYHPSRFADYTEAFADWLVRHDHGSRSLAPTADDLALLVRGRLP